MNKKFNVLMLIAVIVTSISTGYSFESSTTTVQRNPISNAEQNNVEELNPEIVTELLFTDSVTTTETVKFQVEFKGGEALLNQISRFMGVKQKDDSKQ